MKHPVAILTLATLSALHAQAKGPLDLTVPPGWKCEYQSRILGMVRSYTLAKKKLEDGSLLLFGCPAIDTEKAPELLRQLGTEFTRELKSIPSEPVMLSSPAIVDFKGDYFSGQCLAFTVMAEKQELLVRVLILRDQKQTWIAQFAGSKKGWVEGFEILTTLKSAR